MKHLTIFLMVVAVSLMFTFTAQAGNKVFICHVPIKQHTSDYLCGTDGSVRCEVCPGRVISVSYMGWINGHCKHSTIYKETGRCPVERTSCIDDDECLLDELCNESGECEPIGNPK